MEFVGESVGKVAAKLAEYRETNKFPAGSPVAEVHAQLCERFPECCVDDSPQVDGQELVRRVVIQAKKWLIDAQMRKPQIFVAPDVAKSRSESCANCPHNWNWKLLCQPCQLAASDLFEPVIAPRKPNAELDGRCCEIAGDDLSVAVWLEGPKIEVKCDCWRKAAPQVDATPQISAHQS